MNNRNIAALGIGAVLVLAATAAASAFLTREAISREDTAKLVLDKPPIRKPVAAGAKSQTPWRENKQYSQQVSTVPSAPAAKPCDDGNVLGYVAGGAAGALIGSQIGKGDGNTAAIAAGTLGGAYLGGQHLPLRNTLCN
jgi:uncharacterized protein YcfJ